LSITPAGRKVGQQRTRGALGRGHERVFRGTAPGGEPQPGVVLCRTPQVLKGTDGVVEKHYAEARNDGVEARRLERVELRVGADEGCGRAVPFDAGAGGGDHRLRNVDAGAAARSSEPPGDGKGRAACAAADVEHPVSRSVADCFDEQVLEGLEHLV